MARRRARSQAVSLPYDILAIGASWGGVEILVKLIGELPAGWTLPVVVVQHQHPYSGNALERILSKVTSLTVVDVEDKDRIEPAHVYIAPANYHLLIEQDRSFSLSLEGAVNFSRPSIDVTFAGLADVFGKRCIATILTGANNDGAEGIKKIKAAGGRTLAQDPATAEAPVMPEAAIATGAIDAVVTPDAMVSHWQDLLHNGIG